MHTVTLALFCAAAVQVAFGMAATGRTHERLFVTSMLTMLSGFVLAIVVQ